MAMEDGSGALAAEIHRIVTCPYPTQLQALHDLVLVSSDSDIDAYAATHPCQITSLARNVIEALSTWPYTLEIITRLSAATTIRDAFLRARPLLLDQVVAAAIDDHGARTRYVSASVALLQHALPEDLPLPASAQTLLVRLFDQATMRTDSDAVSAVHTLLSGGCRPVVGLLTTAILRKFEQQVFAILRDATDVENQSLSLYCLSIMELLINGIHDNNSDRTQAVASMAALFSGSKAQKTLQLVVLRVIWACKTGSDRACSEALLCIKLANSVLLAVDSGIRQEWCTRNAAVIRKVIEKSNLPDLSTSIRLQVVAFIGCLLETNLLPSSTIEAYEKLLVGPRCDTMTGFETDQIVKSSFARFAPRLRRHFWDELLNTTINIGSEDDSRVTSKGSLLQSILNSAAELVGQLPELHEAVASIACNKLVLHQVQVFLDQPRRHQRASGIAGSCTAATNRRLLHYRSAFCNLLLRTCYATGMKNQGDYISTGLVPLLLDWCTKQQSLENCTHSYDRQRTSRQPAEFVETACTPDELAKGQQWRDRVGSILQDHAAMQQQNLISAFSSICQGLEERCNHVEEPLRLERERTASLEARYRDLESAYSTLEGQVMDRDLRISALETHNDQLIKQSEESGSDKNHLLQRINDSELRLKQIHESSKADLEAIRKERECADIEHATAMARDQEALDLSRQECEQLLRRLKFVEEDLERTGNANRQTHARVDELQGRANQLENELRLVDSERSRLDTERRVAEDRNKQLEQELERQRTLLIDSTRSRDDTNGELEELKIRSRQQLERATRSHEENMLETKQKWEKSLAEMQQKMEEMEQVQMEADKNHKSDQQRSEAKIQESRKRIDRLTKDCAKKDAQVAEAHEMRNRLMNAMGLNTALAQSSPRHSALPYRSASSAGTPYTQPPKTPARPASQPDLEEDATNLSFESLTSSQHGPTPKRPKPRQSFKVPTLQQPRLSLGPRSAKSVLRNSSALKRHPLAAISPNTSPARAGRSPGKVAFRSIDGANDPMSTGAQNAIADWSFNTDLLTGTPGKALGARYDEMDESTADA